MSCANDIQDMSAALQLLQDPQSRQLLGEGAATALIERQLGDMAITLVMIEQGQVKFDNNKAMLDAMYGATKTAIELCAVVPLAGPCRVADMGLTAAEIGVSFAKGDYSEGATQLISEGAAQVVGDGVSKSLSSKWWGNIYGYLTGKAVEAAPQILECPTCEPKL
jgi:ABC-type sulfate transport system substrate-binding protein